MISEKIKKTNKKSNENNDIMERVGKYNLMDELSRSSGGLTIEQPADGDAAEAAKQIRKLLNLTCLHTMVATDSSPQEPSIPRTLMGVPIKIFSNHIQALLDTGAVPSLLASQLCKQLSLKPEKSKRNIKVADGSMAPTCGTVRVIPISFGAHSALFYSLVVDEMPVDMIIGIPTLEQLETIIDIGHSYMTVTIDAMDMPLSFDYEQRKPTLLPIIDETDSYALTSDDSLSFPSASSESKLEEAVIVTLRKDPHSKEKENGRRDKINILEEKLAYFSSCHRGKFIDVLRPNDLVALLLHDLSQCDTAARHNFELTDDSPITY